LSANKQRELPLNVYNLAAFTEVEFASCWRTAMDDYAAAFISAVMELC
jgi:hypothetical protein